MTSTPTPIPGDTARPRSPLARARWPIAALTTVVVVTSCTTFVLRHGWDDQLGPVVPHDTFPADCSLCHQSGSWHELRPDFSYDHEKETGVALLGAHAGATCLRCHNDRGPVQQFADRGCMGCHTDVHRGNLGVSCDDCHDQTSWRPTEMIAQHNRTRFPLVGAHASTDCYACHPGATVGNFAGADPDCASCHQSTVAQSIDHLIQGWTSGCDRCHRETGWRPAAFTDHPMTFALTAGHGGLNCTACHAQGSFQGLSTDCVSCHLADYNATIAPDHIASGFPTDCMQCHSTVTWGSGTFAHNQFPLTGPHNLDCMDCHTVPMNFMQFSCIDCHAHREGDMADEHDDVPGYVWSSPSCYMCHPDGRE